MDATTATLRMLDEGPSDDSDELFDGSSNMLDLSEEEDIDLDGVSNDEEGEIGKDNESTQSRDDSGEDRRLLV